jgi:hypothetical protein
MQEQEFASRGEKYQAAVDRFATVYEERGSEETACEEVYHYRFHQETGFGGQLCFQPDSSSQCFLTRNGDTFLLIGGIIRR